MTQLLESLDGGSGTEEDEGDEEVVEREREDLDVNQTFIKEEVMQEKLQIVRYKETINSLTLFNFCRNIIRMKKRTKQKGQPLMMPDLKCGLQRFRNRKNPLRI